MTYSQIIGLSLLFLFGCLIFVIRKLDRLEESGNKKGAEQISRKVVWLKAAKELLIIIIGALVALAVTAWGEKWSNKSYVADQISAAKKALELQVTIDKKLLALDLDEEQLRVNIDRHYAIIMDRVLEDETVLRYASSAGYSLLHTAASEASLYYDLIKEGKIDPAEGLVRLQDAYDFIIEISDIEIYGLKTLFSTNTAEAKFSEVLTEQMAEHENGYRTSWED